MRLSISFNNVNAGKRIDRILVLSDLGLIDQKIDS